MRDEYSNDESVSEREELIDAVKTSEPGGTGAVAAKNLRGEIYDWFSCLVSALLFCVILFVFFARVIGVIGSSMEPTLKPRDMVVISNLFYTPEQGDVVVFRKESFKSQPLVKRIIATEGQTIEIDASVGAVIVDGIVLQEDYIAENLVSAMDFDGPMVVPEGQLFVMGDNRNHSQDSRVSGIGFVDMREVMGKVYFVLLPLGHLGSVY